MHDVRSFFESLSLAECVSCLRSGGQVAIPLKNTFIDIRDDDGDGNELRSCRGKSEPPPNRKGYIQLPRKCATVATADRKNAAGTFVHNNSGASPLPRPSSPPSP